MAVYEVFSMDYTSGVYMDESRLAHYEDADVVKPVTQCHTCGSRTKILRLSYNVPRCASCAKASDEVYERAIAYQYEA